MLSLILSGQNYKPLGAPPLVRSEPPPVTREFSNADVGYSYIAPVQCLMDL